MKKLLTGLTLVASMSSLAFAEENKDFSYLIGKEISVAKPIVGTATRASNQFTISESSKNSAYLEAMNDALSVCLEEKYDICTRVSHTVIVDDDGGIDNAARSGLLPAVVTPSHTEAQYTIEITYLGIRLQ